ncbi:MAG: hypothetical protein CSB47_07410 [Proteobacteria bacterium]|nr:MAG: hypothetical protein CSB47_07410 [Pseudomonadota bacterium]
MSQVVVCALYKFVTLDKFANLRQPLLETMLANGVRGTLLLAQEGINGTIAGSREGIDAVLNFLKTDPRLAALDSKESYTDEIPFKRTKVKLKKEIVTMGVEGIDPKRVVGTYVDPKDWNALISDPDVLLIDTRNNYEYQVGTFKNAINPNTDSFRQFPAYISENVLPKKPKKVAMFCTGGIRCEKSTAYLKEQGIDEVYHLKGGILKYLENVDESESLWQGECFVFDDRVTVNHQLERGHYDQCHACRLPITEEDKRSDKYQPGVSCPSCYDRISAEKRARFAERERQIQLAKQRGEEHIGGGVACRIEQARLKKLAARKRQRERDRLKLVK